MLRPLVLSLCPLCCAVATAQDAERFETRVRPVLAQRCQPCHGSEQQKSGLRLDHGNHVLRGGERGPAVDRGHPAQSRLLAAISYEHVDLQMPPKGRLPDDEAAALREWVLGGAFWPDEPLPAEHAAADAAFDLEARRAHWAWQPLRDAAPPAVAEDDASPGWVRDPIDRFVLAKVQAHGLRPAPAAAPEVLLRRLWFDLIGLPPPAERLQRFLADPSDRAYDAIVDELLASPQYGVRWARHWLDLMRYSETLGHEFDFPIANAWRYRDYVVRALNRDVPYDEFVVEHIAGDLLPRPRLDPDTGANESVQGTASWWFCEQTHSPVDSRQHQSDRIANQIDVYSKTFLGVTVACARCHDHKFDAIGTADFYALYGYLNSSRHVQQPLFPVDPAGELWQRARITQRQAAAELLPPQFAEGFAEAMENLAACATPPAEDQKEARATARWRRALDALRKEPTPPEPGSVRVLGSADDGFAAWQRVGDAFGGAVAEGPFLQSAGERRAGAGLLPGRTQHSAAAGLAREGILLSPTFRLQQRYLHVLAAGRHTRLVIMLEGLHVVRDPIYGELYRRVDRGELQWFTFDLGMWQGLEGHLQCIDQRSHGMADPVHNGEDYGEHGWLAVQLVAASDHKAPPRAADLPLPADWYGDLEAPVRSERVQRELQRIAGVPVAALGADGRRLLRWLLGNDLLRAARTLPAALSEHREALAALPPTDCIPAMADGDGRDSAIFVRGGHRTPGDIVPRRFLAALGGGAEVAAAGGSGRLQLARATVDEHNPLPARVHANRLWHHLFGRGLSRTVDNFGVLGEAPTHPELLDHLARALQQAGWSQKALLRRIVRSATYRMGGAVDASAHEQDPRNDLLHHRPPRRLQGEAVRDALLAIGDALDPTLGGPPVPLLLNADDDARGRPGEDGPLDGRGRRSLYLAVRRNFLPDFLLAFDLPIPFTTVAVRNVSNVPAQALTMWNDPFVMQQCERAGAALLAEHRPDELPALLYWRLYGRCGTPAELAAAQSFVRRRLDDGATAAVTATDLVHTMVNGKEFLFVR